MNHLLRILFFTLFFSVCISDGLAQSIGYSLSTTLPKSNEIQDPPPRGISEYRRSFELSAGISFYNNSDHNMWKRYNIQARLSRHNSYEKFVRPFPDFRITESKASKYLLDIEVFYFVQNFYKGFTASIGMKNSLLLYSNRTTTVEEFGIINKYDDTSISEVKTFRFDALLKLSWYPIRLSNSLYIIPSYVLGHNLTHDFKSESIESRFFNHRMEVSFYKYTDRQKRKR